LPVRAPLHDRVDRGLDELGVDGDLEAHLLEQVDLDVHTTIRLVVPLLLACPHRVGYRHLEDLSLVQLFFDVVQLMGLNVCRYQLHLFASCSAQMLEKIWKPL
jgi:hypothetical protein